MNKFFMAALFMAGLIPVTAGAVTILDSNAESSIRDNCTDAQQSLQALQRADTVTRINRGNNYATMQNLMASMSARSAANTYNIADLTRVTREFTESKDLFVDQYTEYEISLRTVISMSCTEDPILFYDRLEGVREQRAELSGTVEKLNELAEEHEAAVLKLRDAVVERADD